MQKPTGIPAICREFNDVLTIILNLADRSVDRMALLAATKQLAALNRRLQESVDQSANELKAKHERAN